MKVSVFDERNRPVTVRRWISPSAGLKVEELPIALTAYKFVRRWISPSAGLKVAGICQITAVLTTSEDG